MSINLRFVNEAGDDLIPGKIHSMRRNYVFWKKFEGKDIELFVWEGKPYRKGSKHKVVCVKRIVSVQSISFSKEGGFLQFYSKHLENKPTYPAIVLARNDGFATVKEMFSWFADYPDGEMCKYILRTLGTRREMK
jgi:hypothetical protein